MPPGIRTCYLFLFTDELRHQATPILLASRDQTYSAHLGLSPNYRVDAGSV